MLLLVPLFQYVNQFHDSSMSNIRFISFLLSHNKISVFIHSRHCELCQIASTLEVVAFVKVFSLNSFSIMLPVPCTMILYATSVTASSDLVYC